MVLVRQVVLSPARLKAFAALSEEAIQRAIEISKDQIRHIALLETPFYTGRLAASFDIASTPRSIVFKWSAIDPESQFDYAGIVEKGRSGGTLLTPKTAEAMAFPVPWKGGQTVFAKSAIQGGFSARNYAAAVHQQAVEILSRNLANELALIGG